MCHFWFHFCGIQQQTGTCYTCYLIVGHKIYRQHLSCWHTIIKHCFFNESHSNPCGGILLKEWAMTWISPAFHTAMGIQSLWLCLFLAQDMQKTSLCEFGHKVEMGSVWPNVSSIRISVSQFSGLNVKKIMDMPPCLTANMIWHQNSSSSQKGCVLKYTNTSSLLNPRCLVWFKPIWPSVHEDVCDKLGCLSLPLRLL